MRGVKRGYQDFSTGVYVPPSSVADSGVQQHQSPATTYNAPIDNDESGANPNPVFGGQEEYGNGTSVQVEATDHDVPCVQVQEESENLFSEPVITEVESQNPDYDHDDPFDDLGVEATEADARAAGPVYRIVVNPSQDSYTGTSDEAILLKWHYRLGHVNMRTLLRVAPGIPGMEELCKIRTTCKIPTCKACSMGKLKAKPLPKATFKRAKAALDRLHIDASGIINCKSYGGHQYFLVIVDDATGYKWTYVMRKKSDTVACLDHLFTRLGEMPKVLRSTPKAIRTDNAGELLSAEAREYLRKHRIWHEVCNAFQHHQNPRSEAAIGNIGMRARTMLQASGVNKRHWPQAVMYACEIDNRTLPTVRGSSMTCFEAFHGVKPDNSKAMPFGCLAYLHRSKNLRKEGKFDPTAIPCVFLGYAMHLGHKGYLLGALTSRRFYISTNVNFAEGEFPFLNSKESEISREFWGTDITDKVGAPIPHGPTIEAWDVDGDDLPTVEIQLEEQDDFEEFPALNNNMSEEARQGVRTRAQRRANPVPAGTRIVPSEYGMIEAFESEEPEELEIPVPLPVEDQPAIQQFGDRNQFDVNGNDAVNDVQGGVEQQPAIEQQEIPNVVNDWSEVQVDVEPASGSIYFDELASFGMALTAFANKEVQHNPAEQAWRDLLALNPEELGDIRDQLRGRTNECDGYDALHSFLGIERIEPEQIRMVQVALNLITECEPTSLAEARQRWDAARWEEATQQEYNTLRSMECFDIVPLPAGCKAIQSRLVYKLKLDRNNIPIRYKARVVAKGYQQRWGVDYVDSFSATAHPTAIRAMLALAASNGWFTNSTDVTLAFINAPIETPVYVRPPKDMEEPDGQVWRLKSSLYGLVTSSRAWWKLLTRKMFEFGFQATTADDCVFSIKRGADELHVMVVVDDMIQVGNDRKLLDEFLTFLRKSFTITDDGPVRWFLGCAYDHDEVTGNINLTQTAYIDRAIERFGLQNDPICQEPMSQKFKVVESDLDYNASQETLHLFRSMVGTLMYCAIWSRPDLAYSVNVLARFMTCPSAKLIKAAKQVLRYLKGTREYGITFFKNDPLGRGAKLYAYCDASDADDPIKRRSTGGYVVFYNGSPVSWSTGLQRLTTLSTCESEYVQAALTAKEVLYLREILQFAGHKQSEPTPIYEDNEAAMKLSENPVARGMSKHIGRRFHFLRQCSDDGHVVLVPTTSANNIADIFTKPLGYQIFSRHRQSLGVSPVDNNSRALLAFIGLPRWKITDRGSPGWRATMWEHERKPWTQTRCKTRVYASD